MRFLELCGAEDAADAFEAREPVPEAYLCLQAQCLPVLYNSLGQAPFAAQAGGAAYWIAGPRDRTPADPAETGEVLDLRVKGRTDIFLYFYTDGHDALPLPESQNPLRP